MPKTMRGLYYFGERSMFFVTSFIYVLYLPLSSYQDYAEAEIDEPFDESAYQDHDQDGAGADFPTDSKGT